LSDTEAPIILDAHVASACPLFDRPVHIIDESVAASEQDERNASTRGS
jgi:hypothetical protein